MSSMNPSPADLCVLLYDGTNYTFKDIGNQSQNNPALAVFNDTLYMAFTGTNYHLNIWSSSDGLTWGNQHIYDQNSSKVGPALAVFNGLLYWAFTGTDGYLNLWSSSDGVTFGDQITFNGQAGNPSAVSTVGPGLGVFNNTLYLAYSDTNQDLYTLATTDGRTWNPNYVTNESTVNPGMAVYQSSLYACILTGNFVPYLMMTPNGRKWNALTNEPPYYLSGAGVALAAYQSNLVLAFPYTWPA